jgi:hypothetical protein
VPAGGEEEATLPKSSILGQAQTFVTSNWWHSQETMAVTGGRIQDTRVAGAAEPKERRVQKEKEDRVSVSQVLSSRGPPWLLMSCLSVMGPSVVSLTHPFSPVFLLFIPQQLCTHKFTSFDLHHVGRQPYTAIIRPSQPHRPIGLCQHGSVHYTKLYDLQLS